MEGDREPVGFLTMPRELRDKVYEYYFEDSHNAMSFLYPECKTPFEAKLLPREDITLVSKQIRAETAALFRESAALFEEWGQLFIIHLDPTMSREAQSHHDAYLLRMVRVMPSIHFARFRIHWEKGSYSKVGVWSDNSILLRVGFEVYDSCAPPPKIQAYDDKLYDILANADQSRFSDDRCKLDLAGCLRLLRAACDDAIASVEEEGNDPKDYGEKPQG